MALKRIRLELARNHEYPEGNRGCGYDFVAPLTEDGLLDEEEWRAARALCRVRRFWIGADDEHGCLVHHRGGRWAFHYDDTGDEAEEPIFRFDRHRFVEGEYVAITEHDGVQRTFRVAQVYPID